MRDIHVENHKRVAIVIPSYKTHLNSNEWISLIQCRKLLGQYDRFFLLPKGLQPDYIGDEKKMFVNPVCLSSRNMYSEFVLSYEFYDLFSNYEYILIYQLDAFVFNDNLQYFCELGYDYYGAKWPYGMECHIGNKQLWYYGNGGFSLRKVQTFKSLISEKKREIDELKHIIPEDLVIAYAGENYLLFAENAIADEFAFELNAEECFIRTGSKLPFGCHGWYRFDSLFWKNIIEKQGYTVELRNERVGEVDYLSNGKQRRDSLLKHFDKNLLIGLLHKLIKKFNGYIYVFGAGLYGLSFINMVKETEINVLGIIDNDVNKVGLSVMGIKISKLSEIKNIRDIPVIIAMHNPENVTKQLELLGLKKGIDYTTSNNLQNEMVSY